MLREQTIKCAFCQGTGENPHFTGSCPVCKGRGKNQIRGQVATCRDCRGSGQKRGTTLTCYSCGGIGMLPDTKEILKKAREEIREAREEIARERPARKASRQQPRSSGRGAGHGSFAPASQHSPQNSRGRRDRYAGLANDGAGGEELKEKLLMMKMTRKIKDAEDEWKEKRGEEESSEKTHFCQCCGSEVNDSMTIKICRDCFSKMKEIAYV